MILVLNCGSQSIKWKLFDEKLKLVKSNKIESFTYRDSVNYKSILEDELEKISGEKIDLIGHRVVHGGRIFTKPTRITEENLPELEKINSLAPLHNPYNVSGINVCLKLFKGKPNIAVFDTEFFAELPEKAFTYALPEDIVRSFGFRKYGFHGTSHEYVARKAAEKIKKPFEKLNIITCHLGGGASAAAIKKGKAIDTSMGFTPLEGLVMMTRSGNIDAGIVLELAKTFSPEKANEILNKQSGVKGICGEGAMLEVFKMMKTGSLEQRRRAKLAFDVFVYSIQKYIGAYFAILGSCDVLVFTGSIGSGLPITRKSICKDLKILKETKVLAIETDEELAIAKKIYEEYPLV